MHKQGGTKGFTIVETLIVLAVVATILIIVLLAVPALQRNSRNTQAKSAANTLAAGWAEQVSVSGLAPSLNNGTSGAGVASFAIIGANTYKISSNITPYYNVSFNFTTSVTYSNATSSTSVSVNNINIIPMGVCAIGSAPNVAKGISTQLAIFYPIEGSNQVGCIQG